MVAGSVLQLEPLRQQVYDFLRRAINRGELDTANFLDLNRLSSELGISRTPLRDALIQLETEGFVTILPRRGVKVNALELADIRHIYEIVGALEGVVVVAEGDRLGESETQRMRALNREMATAVAAGDFTTYYDRNLAFHEVFLALSDNEPLRRTVENLKHRLYDFPRRQHFVAEWEEASIGEHDAFVERIEQRNLRGAADFLRDVHWSFAVQEPFILRYYFPEPSGPSRGGG